MHRTLRELTPEEFRERYGCDRLTASIIGSKFRYITQHMCTALLTTAFSVILRDWYDFAATFSGPAELEYPMPAVSNSLVMFTGTMADAVRNTVEEFGMQRLHPGDVLLSNDPYRIGTHVNDVCFIRPVFATPKQPVGFVALQAHMLDMGGTVPAGFSGTKRNVYENGLVMSPRLLYEGGRPVLETWNLIADNARMADVMMPDIKTINQNLLLGERSITKIVEQYGSDAYRGAIRYSCDASAEAMEMGVRKIPDGVYYGEEFIDCDGADASEEYRVAVKLRIAQGRVEADLSGTSRQARTSINASALDTKTAIGVALKFLLDPKTPFTSAIFRNIDILIPDGSVTNALPPDGAVFLYWESAYPAFVAVLRALSEALSEDAIGGDFGSVNIHNANGLHHDGTPWFTSAQLGGEHGPWSATKRGDGDSYNVMRMGNNIDPATEAIESDVPVVMLRKEYVTDSGGAGEYRGGCAVLKDSLWLTAAEHHSMALHVKHPMGFGVNGGRDGRSGGVWVWREPDPAAISDGLLSTAGTVYRSAEAVAGVLQPDTQVPDPSGEYVHFARIPVWQTAAGAIFRYITNGGGGWGDPQDREPDAVMRDVRDGYVSVDTAKAVYGVVIDGDPEEDPEGLVVDLSATTALRERMTGLHG